MYNKQSMCKQSATVKIHVSRDNFVKCYTNSDSMLLDMFHC